MAKPKNRFFIIANTSDELLEDSVLTKEEAEARASLLATESDDYIFVAELITTHWQNKDSDSEAYMDGDAELSRGE